MLIRRIVLLVLLTLAGPARAGESPPPSPLRNTPPEDRLKEAQYLRQIRRITYAGAKNGEAYFSPKGERISFQAVREADLKNPFYQIYVLDRATGKTQRVSFGKGRTTCSYFHPTKERLLFSTSHLDPDAEKHQADELEKQKTGPARRYEWIFDPQMDLFETDFDGGRPAQLTEADGYDAECAYSPDGSKIVFCSFRDGDGEIYTMDADGKNAKRLTEVKGYDGGPFFSPDGKRIVWRRFTPDEKGAEVWVMNADGSEQRQVTKIGAVAWAPYWHPSMQWLVFACNHEDPAFELYAVRPDGGDLTRITYAQGFDGLPVFSPDGRELMWTSTRDTDNSHVYVADVFLPGLERALPAEPEPNGEKRDGVDLERLRAHLKHLNDPEVAWNPDRVGTEPSLLYAAEAFHTIGLTPPQKSKDARIAKEDFLGRLDLGLGGPGAAISTLGVLQSQTAPASLPLHENETPCLWVLASLDTPQGGASGAALIEIAREMKTVSQFRELKRPLVFGFACEELVKGLPTHEDLAASAFILIDACAPPGTTSILHARASGGWRLLAEQLAAANPQQRLFLIDERTDPDALPDPKDEHARAFRRYDGALKRCAEAKVPALVISGATGSEADAGAPDLAALHDRANIALGAIYRLATGDAKVAYASAAELTTTHIKRPYLGTRPEYQGDGTGVMLKGITPGSPAEHAGLKAGDKLVKLGATELKSAEELLKAIDALKAGEKTTVEILRGGERISLEIVPGAR
ncbi:MAG: PDZ domain-containing protein [Planctomycetota bacterium]|nr:PDZ domain-containing protein [Planctomycetota bacterium]